MKVKESNSKNTTRQLSEQHRTTSVCGLLNFSYNNNSQQPTKSGMSIKLFRVFMCVAHTARQYTTSHRASEKNRARSAQWLARERKCSPKPISQCERTYLYLNERESTQNDRVFPTDAFQAAIASVR